MVGRVSIKASRDNHARRGLLVGTTDKPPYRLLHAPAFEFPWRGNDQPVLAAPPGGWRLRPRPVPLTAKPVIR